LLAKSVDILKTFCQDQDQEFILLSWRRLATKTLVSRTTVHQWQVSWCQT